MFSVQSIGQRGLNDRGCLFSIPLITAVFPWNSTWTLKYTLPVQEGGVSIGRCSEMYVSHQGPCIISVPHQWVSLPVMQ
jgi:hypothetical protein